MTADVLHLDDYRHTEPLPALALNVRPGIAGKATPAGLLHRITHSPFAADIRANAWIVGLLLAALVLLAVTW